MRLVQFLSGGEPRTGLVVGRWIADLAAAVDEVSLSLVGARGSSTARAEAAAAPTSVSDLLALGAGGMARARRLAELIEASSPSELEHLSHRGWITRIDDVSFAAPISSSNTLYCVGRNYADHVAEIGVGLPEAPGIFLRSARSVVGHRQPLVRPIQVSAQLDFEGELAAVIGRPCHRVRPTDALDHVAGYTVFNDGSVRDYQKRMSAFLTPGKNFDRSGSLGPWIVTAEEIADPQSLRLHTTLNGRSMQSASTADMIFDVATIVAHISEFTCLQPGDVVATGTPAGVGLRRHPPRFLVPGDKLAIEIERVGTLENPVIDEGFDGET